MSDPAPFPLAVSLPGFDATATIHRFPDRPSLPSFMVNYPEYDRSRRVKSFHDLETAQRFTPKGILISRWGKGAGGRQNALNRPSLRCSPLLP
jgi:hypothetical protein